MIAQQICVPDHVNAAAHAAFWGTHWPPTSPSIMRTTPMTVASSTLPGRSTFIHQPISSAIGIVLAIVNSPRDCRAAR